MWHKRSLNHVVPQIAVPDFLKAMHVELNSAKAAMVGKAEDYSRSSYATKIGLVIPDILDFSPCHSAFQRPTLPYKEFVEESINGHKQRFITQQLERNQLTGAGHFIDEIEQRAGIRVETIGPGRPRK